MTDEADGDSAANDTAESATDTAESDADAASWWSIEGETTVERVRDGLPQLAIIVVTVWLATSITYNVLSAAFDPISATASIAIGSLYVGLRLRRWLTVDGADAEEREGDPGGDAADDRQKASGGDGANECEKDQDADTASAE